MIELCQHDNKYLAICQHYRAIFDTPKVQQDEGTLKDVSSLSLTLFSFRVNPLTTSTFSL